MVIIIVLEIAAAILGFVFREQLVSLSPIPVPVSIPCQLACIIFPFSIQTEVVEMRVDEAIMSYSTDNPSADVNQLIDFIQNEVYNYYTQMVGKGRQFAWFLLSPFSLTVVVIWV